MPTMRPDAPTSPLRLSIDASALTANWRALDRLSGPARAGAAVKANAYGVGAAQVAPVLRAAGCDDFFVAHWSEVPELLDHVPASRIAVLHGPLTAADAAWARAAGVRPVINSLHQARLWQEAGGGACDLMVDTGINRLGVSLADLSDPLLAALDIDVLHSHLAASEEPDNPLNASQLERWQAARAVVRHRRAALANSAGIALGGAFLGDLTRPGLALYGGVPCAALAGEIRQVVCPQAAIMQVRQLQAGDSVGYNATFTATSPMRVGVVSIGYADGYLRCWSGKGLMRAGGADLPVLGRVSMDMTVVDLGGAPDLREGDWLDVAYALPEASERSGLSQYELLTLLGRRFAR
ncbi:alanine racemase [Novosphingobium arvoryzae]|uniref:Alanine racemase n=2 Tax=Novosphingobium arvoryzae TaxID=1256514 RepID=A0A918VGW3_9SPHN|nr:alanine racemase [Novosphingobium arvoryzae]